MERLQKVLAHAGIASRRACEEMIRQGRVQVNGQVVTEMGTRVDPTKDEIRVDGRLLDFPESHMYIMLNKPPGYLSTTSDPYGRPTVLDLLPLEARVYPVGRLDVDSEGLLLLTSDGTLAHRLTHPRYAHEKEYWVLVDGHPNERALRRLRRGVESEGETLQADEIRVLDKPHKRREPAVDGTWLKIVLHQGSKRQIRRMCAAVGHPVRRLIRVRFGPLHLGRLEPGQWRHLSQSEVMALRKASKV
ncbi:MAG: rRNA pseudouridine synthase [Anaerolineae bacterium]|jgi:23S rRNA pseudouridine2605 synthase|nr:rRNA pseudouridine synthase [Anaerolineae bacterium]MDH7474522.1 pseudouridine synthase [Anaerolineae bacterium]